MGDHSRAEKGQLKIACFLLPNPYAYIKSTPRNVLFIAIGGKWEEELRGPYG